MKTRVVYALPIALAALVLLPALNLSTTRAEGDKTYVQCGNIVDGEFTPSEEYQDFFIKLMPGDSIKVEGKAKGSFLRFGIGVAEPTHTAWVAASPEGSEAPSAQSQQLSDPGEYEIIATNYLGRVSPGEKYDPSHAMLVHGRGTGQYTLFISCVLDDGTKIPAGSTVAAPTPSPTAPGFPGLPAVDFSKMVKLKLPNSGEVLGEITPQGNEIIGYSLDAQTGDKLALSFTRTSGNLNLGLVVLSADRKVFFQTSLVTSDSLTTHLTLPSAGQYTIAVYLISLVPPTKPVATDFQIQARLNP